MFFNFVA